MIQPREYLTCRLSFQAAEHVPYAIVRAANASPVNGEFHPQQAGERWIFGEVLTRKLVGVIESFPRRVETLKTLQFLSEPLYLLLLLLIHDDDSDV